MTSTETFPSPNRGPLTTRFTPPSTCLSTATLVIVDDGLSSQETDLYFAHFSVTGDPECYPYGTSTSLPAQSNWYSDYWYSPGLYCPSGWTTATSLTQWGNLGVGGTLSGVMCCPSGLSYNGGDPGCKGTATSGQHIASVSPALNPAAVTETFLAVAHRTILKTLTSDFPITADGIPLLWRKRDRPEETSVTSSSAQTQMQTQTQTPSGSASGMKEGEKIAIGVGVGIGVPLLAAALFALGAWWALRRRRHQGKTRSDEQQDNRVEADGKPVSELGTSPGVQPAGSSVYELNAVERSEADGRPVSELPS